MKKNYYHIRSYVVFVAILILFLSVDAWSPKWHSPVMPPVKTVSSPGGPTYTYTYVTINGETRVSTMSSSANNYSLHFIFASLPSVPTAIEQTGSTRRRYILNSSFYVATDNDHNRYYVTRDGYLDSIVYVQHGYTYHHHYDLHGNLDREWRTGSNPSEWRYTYGKDIHTYENGSGLWKKFTNWPRTKTEVPTGTITTYNYTYIQGRVATQTATTPGSPPQVLTFTYY